MFNFLKCFKRKRRGVVHPDPVDINSPIPRHIITEASPPTLVFEWEGKEMDKYHWWPMKQDENPLTSLQNNLYAFGGGLDKYDELFCVKSVEYQKTKHYRSSDSLKSDANWAGFCDAAAILSCTRKYPPNSVKVSYNGKAQTFTPSDIESLMTVASYNTVNHNKTLFYGDRFNDHRVGPSEDPNEPYPLYLIDILKKICKDKNPFAIDIDKGVSVWNYPYNKVKIMSTHVAPEQYISKISQLPNTGIYTYYRFIISSNAYPEKKLDFWGWVNTRGFTTTQGWLSSKHPDFVWKKYKCEGCWKGMCRINPEISAKDVYKIYNASLNGEELQY